MKKAYLILENGKVFEGVSFGFEGECEGEIEFAADGSADYALTLTDEKRRGKIVVETFPEIGIYGMSRDCKKSSLKGYVAKSFCTEPSNFRAEKDIGAYLKENKIPAVCGIDTREVVKNIRGRAMKARIAFKKDLFFPAREPVCFAAAPRVSEAKRDESIKSVLVIGSGPIVIGQAAEFDYAGAQACRVLKAEGVRTVLVNSNPATIMTDKALADAIYLEPLTIETIRRVIVKERPDSLLASLGGQTGLTLAMQLGKEGFLQKHGVRLLGTCADSIDRAEDRELFKETMEKLGEPVIPSATACDVETAVKIAGGIGYPVIIRPAFTLGGGGGGVAADEKELRAAAKVGIDASPIGQILVEKYIYGWKEIEFETMRDKNGRAIIVCSMENIDPVGVHTGDSAVVAPALTLSPKEYGMLRDAALRIVNELKIIGGCNCQFALDPESLQYAVIEVNPRVSRSSALASKATGYPIAKVTAKLALGYALDEVQNDITGVTSAACEPAVDYFVVKFPKWPFDKFPGSPRRLGTQMKATGEVMSIGDSFEAALMKAVRGAENFDTLNDPSLENEDAVGRVAAADDKRLFALFKAIKEGADIERLHALTKIDRYFLSKLRSLAEYELSLAGGLTEELLLKGKKLGYTDAALARLSASPVPVKKPAVYKTVDTCSAMYDAKTPYFYSVSEGVCEATALKRSGKDVVVVLGSGPICIGQGIEFDYSSVHCVWTLKEMGFDVVIINNNPETVSTDYDTADRLYFEPFTPEDVMNVLRVEKPVGVVVAFGGQTAIKLTEFLAKQGVAILGTSAEGIDVAEDREKFDALLEKLRIKRPKGRAVAGVEAALSAAEELGYPVLLRPSYVIGGQNMRIVHNAAETETYMRRILSGGIENPVLVDKYMAGTEIEVDVISDGEDVLIPGVMEHIERAGVHSGDSIAVYPPYNLNDKMMRKVAEASASLALSLGTKGLVNIQYLIYGGELYVIEVNPRASRTVPYISKVTDVPMVDIASKVMLGARLKDLGCGTGLCRTPPYYAVKAPVFSFEKLSEVNARLGPEMKSTGEVLGLGGTLEEALFKGLVSAGMVVKRQENAGVLLSADSPDRFEIVSLAKKFCDLHFVIYATPETAEAVKGLGVEVCVVKSINRRDGAFELLESGKISYVVYTGALLDSTVDDYIALHRRAVQLSVPCFTSLDTANALADVLAAKYDLNNTELVDINRLRKEKLRVRFSKMQATGDDYIFIENFGGEISCPESLAIAMCSRHKGVGGYGLVLIEKSAVADAKMRVFNRDGSEGGVAGNSIRSVAKYLYDNGIVQREDMTIETAAGVKKLSVFTGQGKVNYVSVDMGKPVFQPREIPCVAEGEKILDYPFAIAGKEYRINCLSMGNPHCVVFVDKPDELDLAVIGPKFENAAIFPERVNAEFVRVVNECTLRMRVFERGNGETYACGTGACAAVIAAAENGLVGKGRDVTVKVRGGDLTVNYTDERTVLSGDTKLVFSGVFEF